MQRAAVLIGVKKTGNLPKLEAVSASVAAMAKWARDQGLGEKFVRVLTDDNGSVTAQQIKDEIKALVALTTIDQLIVYFSGHGFNVESEFWLLSDAPTDTDAAVNVDGSVRLARYCGIPHVLLVSDCCRSPAEGLQAMQVRGSNIFPNDPASGIGNPVDLLYSCARGKPSLEIADPAAANLEAARTYSALYSEVMLEYLRGEHENALERAVEDAKTVGLLRLGSLADALKAEVPNRLKAKLKASVQGNREVNLRLSQLPDDAISRKTADALISRVFLTAARSQAPVKPVSRAAPITPFTVSSKLFAESLVGDLGKWNDLLSRNLGKEVSVLQRSVVSQAAPFGPQHFETQCGVKIRGGRVVRTVQSGIGAELLGNEGNIVRLNGVPRGGSLVLLVFENGLGAVVPAIPEFIAALTLEDGQLVDVSYEPSDNSWRSNEYQARASDLRSLRSTISASAAFGVFRLDEDGGLALARKMQYAKGIDPSLALYAAYAYDSLQRRDLINEMRGYLESDLDLTFFDISLLSGGPAPAHALPPFPMLSQGWPLLSAYRAELPNSLKGIEVLRVPSLWTLFNPAGVVKIERAILSGEIR
jgi:hypothetical protein